MGSFDNVICNRIMPDGRDGSKIIFQSKTFISSDGDFGSRIYEITSEGHFRKIRDGFGQGECKDPEHYTGELMFYEGADTYVATFENGWLIILETYRQRNERVLGASDS